MIMIMTMITKETITFMRMIAIITDLKIMIDIIIIEEEIIFGMEKNIIKNIISISDRRMSLFCTNKRNKFIFR